MENPSKSAGKRAARRNTEARREQNRIASRVYRERRKQKLALLSELISPENGLSGESLAPDESSDGIDSTAGPSNAEDGSSLNANNDGYPGFSWTDTLPISSTPLPSTSARGATEGFPPHYFSQSDSLQPPMAYQSSSNSSTSSPPSSSSIGTTSLVTTSLNLTTPWTGEPSNQPAEAAAPPSTVIDPALTAASDDNPAELINTDITTTDQTLLNILKTVQHLTHVQRVELIAYLKRQTNEHEVAAYRAPAYWCSTNPRGGGVQSKLQAEARRFASFLERQAGGGLSPAQLSRVYVLEVGFFGAAFANCYALGMTDLEPLMTENGTSVFSITVDLGYHPSQLPAIRSKFKNISPDLQPSDRQLTVGHHPYIDIIPFKTFRENILKALAHDPPLIDEDQMCADFGAGGLVCWGSQQNSLGMEAGVPWDARSWEPQVWFLKKYAHLCGGWDDEMWRATRRWHSARNEMVRFNQ